MRRRSAPRVSTTKPESSAAGADAVVTVTGSVPGTVTVAGAETAGAPPFCRSTVTAQVPAPPPASESTTGSVCVAVAGTRPNERVVGAVKTSGRSARARLTTPPPSRVACASTERASSAKARSPVLASADFTCAGVHAGWRWRRSATAPATCGAAMLVPDSATKLRPGAAETIATPGALTSGFSCSESGVGPLDENEATTFGAPVRLVETAPTVIASGVEPGDETEPRPKSSKSFPAATTGTTPARAAAPRASATMSRVGSISGSPRERLITSMPSATAASMAATSWGELPSRPTSASVGIVSAL